VDTLDRETATPQEHYQYLVRLGFSKAEAGAISGIIPGEWVRASEVRAEPLTPEELATYED
jgi:hypothetical protein